MGYGHKHICCRVKEPRLAPQKYKRTFDASASERRIRINLQVPRIRPLVLLIREAQRRKRVGSLGGMLWPDENRITRRKARTSATIKHEKVDVYLSNAPRLQKEPLCVGSKASPFCPPTNSSIWYACVQNTGAMMLTGWKWSAQRTPCPSVTSSTTTLTSTGLGLNQGLRGERPVTDHLRHSTTQEASNPST